MRTKIACKLFLFFTFITGFVYPCIISIFALLFAYDTSQGSLVYQDNKVIGSKLIGQKFTQDHFFWGRPSAVDYNTIPSGASNLGPTSKDLKKAVDDRITTLAKTHDNSQEQIPADLLYASGSGIDPHISKKAAYFQIDRIAKARNKDPKTIQDLIEAYTESPFFGFSETELVNVFLLNQALENL